MEIMHEVYGTLYKLFKLIVNSMFPVAKTYARDHVSCFEDA